ncbi:TRAP transporter large permease [Stappia taiwanensis]|uniref:TRAP transporter large permease protein n=1 Tax=Stappia taiwanensis TaxID=992267 RepID=A0A838XT89_9HYPH|nr:TRAP transporter large permease [Stappia taiwanensis]MBA4613645.1 TRAP transporter large permease [Stappia taiwanensis]GGE98528.1 C4-dicarboxylate ABC transporter permease [Stappia taiwanensis]
MILTISVVTLLVLLLLRVPIAVATGLVGLCGLAAFQGWPAAFAQVGIIATETVLTYEFAVIPLFIVMGAFIARSGIAEELFQACYAFVGHWRGGLALSTVAACGGFGAVSGSSFATAATMSRIAYPQMKRFGYRDDLATGSIAAGGTLGILIPPSIALVFFGIITESDIGALFMAGILPGILGIVLYAAAVLFVVARNPEAGPAGARSNWQQRIAALRGIWAVLLLFGLVMGGIYGGLFSPTESAGIGAAGALLIAVLRGRASLEMVRTALADGIATTVALMAILIGSFLFANLVNVARLPQDLTAAIESLGVAPLAVIFLIILIYLVLGCILESISMMLLTVPVFYPLVVSLGYDLVWFGVLVVVVVEISLITPPVGLNVFVLRSVLQEVPLSRIFRGVVPFVVADVARVLLVVFVPWLSLALPAYLK